jgi:protein-S-isoprenylcysteine O-methyltransferase Ste14
MTKTRWIRIGDFFFKYRNMVFPLLWVSLFLAFTPAAPEFVVRDIIALAITFSGLALRGAVIGLAYIKRGGLDKKVYADTLVTNGFFVACRNPLYVGNMLIYAGLFILHGNPIVAVLGILGTFLIYQSIIAAEEFFLRGKFAGEYEAYCKEVPRWGFNLRRLGQIKQGMDFSFRRVLVKDYSTFGNALVTMIFLSGLKHYHYDDSITFKDAVQTHIVMVVVVAVMMLGISLAKKKKLLQAA